MAKVLVTGATGFVGKRLIQALLDDGHEVYALCRIKGKQVFSDAKPGLHYIFQDLQNPSVSFPEDIDAAYYLVHGMSEIAQDLTQKELCVANNFISSIKKTKCRQIIYLGGIINDEKKLSPHLRSRLLVEEVLKESGIPTTILRASIIVGAGSASFEIIRDLCEKLPIMIAPKWALSQCQPIAIHDVLFYLTGILLNQACYNKTFDIGGPNIVSFKELMLEYAKARGLKRLIITVPVLTPYLSSLWLVFITSVRFSLCFYLVESIKTSSICMLNDIKNILPLSSLHIQKALELTLQNIAQNEVVSTWKDSWEAQDISSIQAFIEVPTKGCLKDVQQHIVQGSKDKALLRIWSIGGDTGYYGLDWAWKLRGLLDRLLGGVGLHRSRRHPTELEVGDAIDFWRVLRADKETADLILYAEMKLPGDAWLEFRLNRKNSAWLLTQTATFRPKGLFGRLYWYAMLPFHFFIFRKMAKHLAGI